MALLGFEKTLALIRDYRLISIIGHPGAHKTSLAFRIAFEMFKQGMVDRVLSNVPSVWTEDVWELRIADPSNLRACIILDEGGQFLENRHDAKPFMAFLRKMDSFVLVPSFYPPTLKLRTVQIEVDRKYTRIGLPLLRYKVFLETVATQDSFHFYWWNPAEIYGIYDTVAAPVDADEVADFMTNIKNQLVHQTTGKLYSGSKAAGGRVSVDFEPAFEAEVTAMEDVADLVKLRTNQLKAAQDTRPAWRKLLFGSKK